MGKRIGLCRQQLTEPCAMKRRNRLSVGLRIACSDANVLSASTLQKVAHYADLAGRPGIDRDTTQAHLRMRRDEAQREHVVMHIRRNDFHVPAGVDLASLKLE